jgi:DNA-binding transcriptional LysR family regulator
MARLTRQAYKDLTLQQLKSFSEVCRKGSYAAAARTLVLSSPTVWEQMKGLEQHYGVQLFQRDGKGVRPTPEAERLLALVEPHLAALESAREILHQESGLVPRQITVVTNLRVLAAEISRGMRTFQESFEDVQLRMIFAREEEMKQILLAGEADFGLGLEPPGGGSPRSAVEYEWAGELGFLLLTLPDHPLAGADSLHLRDVARQPLILTDKTFSRQRVEEVFQRHQLRDDMNIVVETSSDEYTAFCVRAGMGVGIALGVPHGLLYGELAVRSLKRWFGSFRIGVLVRRGSRLPPAQLALAGAIRAEIHRVKP